MEENKPAPQSSFAEKIFGFNPFPKDDARREQWETNAIYVAEEIALVEERIWRTLPPETASSEQFLAHALDSVSGVFDVWAYRLLIFTVNGPASVILYEECLTSMIAGLLQKKLVPDQGRFGLSKQQFLLEIKVRLKQRKAHWKASAFRLSREREPKVIPEEQAQPVTATDQSHISRSSEAGPFPPTTAEPETPPLEDRRALVDAYIAEVLEKNGKQITRKDFWKAAGYTDRTEFERWQRSDPKTNAAANSNFARVLRAKPHLKQLD